MAEFPLTVQSYQSRSPSFSSQLLLNMYPESGSTGTKSQALLIGTPALKTFSEAGSGPGRGMDVVSGVLHSVSGNQVFSIDANGAEILLGTGTGAGISPVSMANNGDQLCIVSDKNGFIVQGGTVTQITDPDFPGADSVTYIDGFFVFNLGATIFNSALQDGFTYNALDTAEAEYDPDTVVAVFADHSDLLVFGQNTIEPYYNAAVAIGFPFLPRGNSAREVGLLARDTVKKLDNMVYFLGSDKRGGRVVWRLNGYVPERVSTHAIEKRFDEFVDIETAIAFTYGQEGHAFYCIKLPSDVTLCFDVATGLWHERQSFAQNDWRVSHYATAYNRRFVGDADTGKIFELDLDTYLDDGSTTIQRIITWAPLVSDNNQWVMHRRVTVDIDTGVGFGLGQSSDPVILLRWSDDGGITFTNFRSRKIGKAGERKKRVFWNRLGKSRSRVYQIAVYDPVAVHIKGAYIRAKTGAW